jgi:hypothetical protein
MRTLTQVAAEQQGGAPPSGAEKSNEDQPILLVTVKDIEKKEYEKLARVKGLRIFIVNSTSKNLNMSELRDKFDLVILDAFNKDSFQMLRQNYRVWQEDFNLSLYQRSGFSSDNQFVQYFENVIKKLPLDATDVEEFKKGCNSQPYIKRPQPWYKVILKKVVGWVLKL